MPPDLVAGAMKINAYPTFCEIPPVPTDLRSAAEFRRAVVQTRLAGARLVEETAPSTFSLAGTSAFAAAARAEAAPPPPFESDVIGTDAFLRTARDRALPPVHGRAASPH